MPKTRSLFAGLGAIAVTALCGASVYTMIVPQTPRVLYNKSDSAPIGWYKLDPEGAPVRDAMVAAFAPQEARNLADLRDYLPSHIPLLKSVWAVAGEEVCSSNGIIRAPNRPDIHAAARDGLGRELPHWEGCVTLEADEVFLVSTYVQNSYDSRYFGPVPLDNVLGTTQYLGENPLSSEDQGNIRGLGAGLGAEGKIKAGVPPCTLTPCLLIIFGVHPVIDGVNPFLAQSPVATGVEGGAPFSKPNVYGGY